MKLTVCNDLDWYNNCSHYVLCGNLTPTTSYPFWGGEFRPKECGYPDMEIRCNNRTATMLINGMEFYVLNINQNARIITLARVDYRKGNCLKRFDNTTIDFNRFDYGTTTLNVTVLYGCPRPRKKLPGMFKCKLTGVNESYGYYRTGIIGASQNGCHAGVVVPIRDYLEPQLALGLSKVFLKGFEATYKFQDGDEVFCRVCEGDGSEGRCGYDLSENRTVCLCQDGKSVGNRCLNSTSSPGKNHSKKALVIGLCVGGGLLAIIVAGVIFEMRRRQLSQNEIPASNQLSQNEIPALNQPSRNSEIPMTRLNNPSDPSPNSELETVGVYQDLRIFFHDEIAEATDNFDESREIANGILSTVYYGRLRDGREVAIKRFHENTVKRMGPYMNEVAHLSRLRHKNLVVLYGCTPRLSKELALVYEYVSNGTLEDHLYGKYALSNQLTWKVRLGIAVETAEAISNLHAYDVVHRDIKSSNILLDENFQVKVADFGLAKLFPVDASHVSTNPQGTYGYVDPQYNEDYQLTYKSDVYSFGVVLAELISSKPAVDKQRRRNDINLAKMAFDRIQRDVLDELIDPNLGYYEDYVVQRMIDLVADIALRCLETDRDMRPPMYQVVELLQDIQKEQLPSSSV